MRSSSGRLHSSKVGDKVLLGCEKWKKNQGQRRKLQLNRELAHWPTKTFFDLITKGLALAWTLVSLIYGSGSKFWPSSQLQSGWQSLARMQEEPRTKIEAHWTTTEFNDWATKFMAVVCLFVWSMVQAQSSGHLLSSKVLLSYKEMKCKKKKNQGQRRKLQLNRKLEQWTTTALFGLDVKNLLFFVWKWFWQSSQLQSWWQSVAQMQKVEKEPRANKEASK